MAGWQPRSWNERPAIIPGWADTDWLNQLVAEQLVTIRNKRG
jgi:hypothetical protein